jgi:SAM-dependent methyltransferase
LPVVEVPGSDSLPRQLRRQTEWLRESYLWLIRTKVLTDLGSDARVTALDVGCGPGFVMDTMRADLEVSGVDLDTDMVTACRSRGLDVREASAYDLPYGDGAFDIVFCTWLLMWLDNPQAAISEMARVSRRWVLCLAEPDMGSRIDHPEGLADVRDLVVAGFQERGADPLMGRKLRGLFRWAGLATEVGTHPGVWDVDRLRVEFTDEWDYVERAARGRDPERLARLKDVWLRSLDEGVLFSYNPVFYALGRKGD